MKKHFLLLTLCVGASAFTYAQLPDVTKAMANTNEIDFNNSVSSDLIKIVKEADGSIRFVFSVDKQSTTHPKVPFTVINSVPGTAYTEIDPAKIESAKLLDAPAAVALYGPSAANGALVISTREDRVPGPYKIK